MEFDLKNTNQEFLLFLNPKTAGGGGCQIEREKEREKPWFFVTFYIILRHNFPEYFIELPQVVQKI